LGNPRLLKLAGIDKTKHVVGAQYLFENSEGESRYDLKSIDIGLNIQEKPADKESFQYLSSLLTFSDSFPSAGYITANMAKKTGDITKYHIMNIANLESTNNRNVPMVKAAFDHYMPSSNIGLSLSNTDNYLKVERTKKQTWTRMTVPIRLPVI